MCVNQKRTFQKLFEGTFKIFEVELSQRVLDILQIDGLPLALAAKVVGAMRKVENEDASGAGKGCSGFFRNLYICWQYALNDARNCGLWWFKIWHRHHCVFLLTSNSLKNPVKCKATFRP